MNSKIWLSPPHLSGDELSYVQTTFDSNWISTQGPHVDNFEDDIKHYLNTNKEVVALNSGTSALHLALRLLNVRENDTVLCQSLTFVASANAISYLKANPVFIDSESETWNLCPELLENAILDSIKNGQHPRAIIAVSLYGMPYKIRAIHSIAEKYNIPVIEDSAEALGSEFEGQKCGTFGDLAVFSFNGNKIITTSGGGALVCKNQSQKEDLIYYASQAKDDSDHYNHCEIGYNYRLSNVLAGIGRAQMQVLNQRILSRQENFKNYKRSLSNYSSITFLDDPNGVKSNKWLTSILLPNFEMKDGLLKSLRKNNIDARSLWKPMHQQPIYADCKNYLNGVSDNLFSRGICLPSGSNLCQEDYDRIINIIKNYIEKPTL